MRNRKLIIDGQVFQTEARDRGMGRYSVSLVQSLLKSKVYKEIEVLLNKTLTLKSKDRQALEKLFPGVKFTSLDLMTTQGRKFESAARHNLETLNAFISEGSAIDYLIPSPFQEPVVSVFPANVKKLLIFYDLIPFLYSARYQPIMQYDNYLKRYRFIFEADTVFTISQTVADDLQTYLGVPRERLVRIDGAPIRTDHTANRPQSFSVPDSYILMPTSDDPRKNNLRAVLGFEEYRASSGRDDLKLVITSTIHARSRDHLSLFSKHLVFTGSLPESELNWLYRDCEAVLFVPESEGLGLPVLEAAEANKKVVCSSLGVFKEISKDAFFYCDHESQQSIAEALQAALNPKNQIASSKYKKILSYYSWPMTAKRFLAGVDLPERKVRSRRPRLAIFTPAPDGLSAIGKVVAESHPTMSEYFDIDYYVEKGLYSKPVRPDYLRFTAPCYSAQEFSVEQYRHYDAVVYHIGNGDYHLESIKNGLYLPGIAVIHDTNISEAYRVLKETDMMHESRVKVEEMINAINPSQSSSHLTSLLNNQLGVLCHSEYARAAAKEVVGSEEVTITSVNLPTAVPELRTYRGLSRPVIGLAGIIADVKGIGVIESIAKDERFMGCDIRLFGFSHATQETIDRLNRYDNVMVTTNLSDFDFQSNISKLDIFVNYRLKYNGETSLSTIEAMRQGVAVIVRRMGWYDELPDEVVIKTDSVEEVLDKLKTLVLDRETITRIGSRARDYIESRFGHKQYAEGLLSLLESTASKDGQVSTLVRKLKQGRVTSVKQYIRERGLE